ncbi:MAG: inositol-1-monophosphatase [Cyanobacteria bacterium QS_8_64_29]|nr:MAG: inositol-1-monophosphatase [Cyanobacteria bacterium QS_8_64_29]
MPTPRQILAALLPQLRVAAAYARQLQPQIRTLPAKEAGSNWFAAALTDADLAVQNLVEVTLLATFPQLRFYGEERDRSYNTSYFRAPDLGPAGDPLVTLDPIDGTQFYIDGHANYQIVLSVLNWDDCEAALAVSPARNCYYYALRGESAFWGSLDADLASCHPLPCDRPEPAIFLGWEMGKLAPALQAKYRLIDVATSYSSQVQIPNFNGILSGELAGAVLPAANFIDGVALTFLAREAGCTATLLDGSPLPPLHAHPNFQLPGVLVAASASVHRDLRAAVQQAG